MESKQDTKIFKQFNSLSRKIFKYDDNGSDYVAERLKLIARLDAIECDFRKLIKKRGYIQTCA